MKASTLFILVVAACIFGTASKASAQFCWQYDMDCCRCCDGHETVFPCSVCWSGFSCCPKFHYNGIVPTRTQPIYTSGYLPNGTLVATQSVYCVIEALTPNEACDKCIGTQVTFGTECIVDVPPLLNCGVE